MSENGMFNQLYSSASTIDVQGSIAVPKGYLGPTNIIVPDEIVNYCIETLDLNSQGMIGIDPMCGVGTIPRCINNKGGNCVGVEVDDNRYQAASQHGGEDQIIHGDFITQRFKPHSFDYVFTSMPFDWFRNGAEKVDSKYSIKFRELLNQNGIVLIDALHSVTRDNKTWLVAEPQSNYLEDNGFRLDNITRFNAKTHVDESSESLILKFVLR